MGLAGSRRILLALALAAAACDSPRGEADVAAPPSAQAPEPAGPPRVAASDGYLSSDACRACHPGPYDAWHASYHRTMTQRVTPETVQAAFDGERTIAGRRYRMARRGDAFWVEFDDPQSRPGAVPARLRKQLVLSTGSHHMQIFWYATGNGREMGQFPVVWWIAERSWIPRNAIFLRPPYTDSGEIGRWNSVCVRCHATHGKPRIERVEGAGRRARTYRTQVAELGIACEACHGPGEEHVAANHDPQRRYRAHFGDAADPTIVNPARLPAAKSAQVCGQCHGISLFPTREDVARWNADGFPYRPGGELADSRFVVQPSRNRESERMREALRETPHLLEDHYWSDGMVRVSGREYHGLVDSPCYRGGEFSCLSCHTMHREAGDARPLAAWRRDQLKVGMEGDRACLGCHADFEAAERRAAHTHHGAASEGSRCQSCHMPYTTYGLLKAIRSHQIESPSVQATLATGRPNACNQCHLDRSLGWAADRLAEWYGAPVPALGADERGVAAGALWALTGDAGERALAAWSLGWAPAQEASGTQWMAPYLAELLVDPYDAVRFVARRSLATLPGFADFAYDFLAPEPERAAARERALAAWRAAPLPGAEALLLRPDGSPDRERFASLLERRDGRRVVLSE